MASWQLEQQARERFGRQQQARMASWQLAGSQNSAQKVSQSIRAKAPYRNLDIDIYIYIYIIYLYVYAHQLVN